MRGIVIALLAGVAAFGQSVPELSLAAHNGTLRIVVAGDTGDGTARVAKGIAKIPSIDAVIIPGDNIYPCGVSAKDDPRWRILDPLSNLGVPIFAVLGNHDYCGDEDAQINAPLPNWKMPAKQYAIRSEVADFAMIDTEPYLLGHDQPTASFVRNVFHANAKWRIVVGHHVVRSSGYHGYFPRAEARRMRQLLPVLRDAKTDLYICGHDHHQELLDGHPRFLVSGAASKPIPPVLFRNETLFPTNGAMSERIGFTLLEIKRDSMTITFYDERARKLASPFHFTR